MATVEQIRAYAATVTNGQTIERYNEYGDIVEVGFRTSEWVYAWFNVVTYVDGRTDCSYNYHYSQRTGKATKRKWDGRNLEKKIEACTTSYNIVNESKLTSRYSEAYELTVKLESREIIEVPAEEVKATVNADGLAEVNNATLLKLIGKQVSANSYFTRSAKIEDGRATFKVCFFGEVRTIIVIFKGPTDQDNKQTNKIKEAMKTAISINDFDFITSGFGHYRVTYTSPITGKKWTAVTSNMMLIDATMNADEPKKKDLNALKYAVKNGY